MRTHASARLRSWVSVVGAALICLAPALESAAAAQASGEDRPTASAGDSTGPALLPEPRLLTKGIRWIEGFGSDEAGLPNDGFYPEVGPTITGAGWLTLGPGYRQHVWRDQALVDVSAAVSLRSYKTAQARLEFPYLASERMTAGVKALWQDFTQVRYFGSGPDSLELAVSDYRLQATDVVTYATWQARPQLWVSGAVGALSRPSLSSSTGPFDRDEPDTLRMFAGDPAASLARQPRFVHADLSIVFDNRDSPSHPTRGGLYRAAYATYRDRSAADLTFGRWEMEAARFIPVARDSGVIAVRWWTVLSQTEDGHSVPFYMLPSLGGHNTLRGFADYRFHDRHMLVVNAESRWALLPHVDGAVFADAGSVAARARNLDLARTSYGFGFRLHTDKTTLARFDVARSVEGWRFLLKLTDPLRIGRIARRTAVVPFVP